ncbi:hypothetical protein ACP4OV_002836 [Aristida adscensionis]
MPGKEDIKVLGTLVSPFVIHVRMALIMKGVSYEYLQEDLSNKSELLLSSNPVHKKVPVLIHNSKPICESLIIVQYIDEVFAGPSILPADPYKRAIARFWTAYIEDMLFPAWFGIVKATTEVEKTQKIKETLDAIEHLEEAFAKCSKGKAFFGGDSIGHLDLTLGSFLFWFEALHQVYDVDIINTSRTPLLAAWAERFGQSSIAKEVVPEVDKAVQYIKRLQVTAAT